MWLNIDNNAALQYATVKLVASGAGKPYVVLNSPGTTVIAGLAGSAGIVWTNTAAGVYTLNVQNAVNDTFGGILENNTGILALTKSGAGTLTLSGTNTYTGLTTVSGGVLKAANSQAFGAFTDTITVNSGSAVDMNGADLHGYTNGITITGQVDANNGALYNSGAYSPTIPGGGQILKVVLGGNASIGGSGHRMDISRSGLGATCISGAYTMTKVGPDTISILGVSSGVTAFVINGGFIQLENDAAFGSSPISINSGAMLVCYGNHSISNSIAMNGGAIGTTHLSAYTTTFSGPISLTGANTFDANSIILSNAVSGAGSLTMSGTGTLTLSGALNSYSGNTTISAGTLQLGAASVIPNGAGKGDVSLTGTLDLYSFNDTINSLTGAGTIDNSNSAAGAATLTIGSNNAASTFSGLIKDSLGTVAITKIGNGTLTLSGQNRYSGGTIISGGVLNVANNAGSATGTGPVTVNAGTLSGSGKIGGAVTVNSGATISPGSGGTSKLSINNNLTFALGSACAIDLRDSLSDTITISGTTTLGNATLAINLINAPLAGRSYLIVHNVNPVIGTFNGIAEGGAAMAIYGPTTYTFVVSYVGGAGNDIVLTLASKPSITMQPVSQSAILATPVTFSFQAGGTMPLTYSWTENGTAVGTNSNTVSLTSVGIKDTNALFQCQVSNMAGMVSSSICTLHVITSIANFSYSKNSLAGLINTQFVPDTPKVTGAVTSYSISPTLPTGLLFNTVTGIISGTPTVQADSAVYLVTASNGATNSTANISIKVFSPVKVSTSPANQTTSVGGAVKFFVVAGGTKPYTYAWMSLTSPPTAVGTNSDTLKLTGIDTTYNNATYKCIVQNTFQGGSFFDTSKACTLHVILPPKIVKQPVSQTIVKASKAVLSITAGGTPPFSYYWVKNGNDTISISNPDTLGPLAIVDDKSTYACVVANSSGSVTSALCTLRVVSAAFSGSPQTGIDTLTVSFADSSTGGVSKWKWDFGDNTTDSVQNPKHKYAAPDTYAVKLKVNAGGVSDSIVKTNFVMIAYSKPKPMFSGTPTTAQDSVTVKFTDLSTGVITSRLWNFGDSTAFDTTKNPVHTFTKPGSYTVTLTVTGPGGTNSSIQAALIYVYSSNQNPMRISGRRLSTTSVELTLSNYDSLHTSKNTLPSLPPWADSAGVYFKKNVLPSNTLTDSLLLTINIPRVQAAVKPFKDTVLVPASLPEDSMYYGFATALNWNDGSKSPIAGGNGTLVFMKDTAHFGNGLVISGVYLGVDTAGIYLHKVSSLDTGRIDSVVVWYGLRDSANFSDTAYSRRFTALSVINGASGDSFTYKVRDPRFNTDTVRAFAAVELVGKNRLTSPQNDTSFMVGRLRPQNPIRLKAKPVSSNGIQLTWNKITGYDRIRIWKGLKAVPAGPDSISRAQYDTLIPASTDTSILSTGLTPNTRYYFGAQVLQNALWSKVTDSASASATPLSIDSTRQAVLAFSKVHDTVYAFNGRVMLANESPSDTIPVWDSLRIFTPPASGLNGLVPVSIGVSFINVIDRMHVGLKVDSLLIPWGSTIASVRIYQLDSSGYFFLDTGAVINPVTGIVSVLTKNLGEPFIAMVDTIAPRVTVLSSLKGPVPANTTLYDTIQIIDNILNASYMLQSTKGASSFTGADTIGAVWGLVDTLIVKVASNSVNSGSGLRAIFVTTDGVHYDTQNVSRQVVSDNSAVSTLDLTWTPLWVKAQLADSSAKTALKGLAGKNGWVYDNTQFRLFRWYAYDKNSATDDKYIEYADSTSEYFDFKLGRLFWIKTKTHTVLQLGSGVTTDLSKPDTVPIASHQMADIAVPFDFPILIGDVIAATSANSKNIAETGDSLIGDSLWYYNFIPDKTNIYHTEAFYINDGTFIKNNPAMSKTDTLTSGFFSVYNPFKTQVFLNIPGISATISKQKPGLSKKAQSPEGWSVRVAGNTSKGSVLSSVYCGQVNGPQAPAKFYPAAPLIEGEGIRVCDQNLRQWGHEMARGACAKDGGVTYLLAFTGTSGSLDKITFHAENTEDLPKGLRAIVLDPGSDSVLDASSELHASVGDFRTLVIGSETYIAKAKAMNRLYALALIGVSPNPFGRMLRIRYSLPFTGVSQVNFSMVDLRGRELWTLRGQTGAGPKELVWSGLSAGKRPIAAGMYVLSMKALDDKGKISGVFQRRVTYLP
jgi:autotransporter-associated beta strand protein